ncbi:MAG TPA: orotate phosphoribosyltransferase [bacterium]|nr:orotate phosphoribosyltransferase [bacterium]
MLEENRDASGVVGLMEESGALLAGHFVLSSGLHSARYIQCALLLEVPARAEIIGRKLAGLVEQMLGLSVVDVVASPAIGGIVIGHEVARALGARSVFAERTNGVMALRRGFAIARGERVLVVEDVITTGGSTREVMEVVSAEGGKVVGVGAIVNRGGGVDFKVPLAFLVKAQIDNFNPEVCPMCKAALPFNKPGSRQSRGQEG